jgi:hypothetical protein
MAVSSLLRYLLTKVEIRCPFKKLAEQKFWDCVQQNNQGISFVFFPCKHVIFAIWMGRAELS